MRMPNQNKNNEDRRVKRTKSLVFDAFFELVQSLRYDELKTKDIIARSGIGRSTFYEHFLDKDDVLSQSLEYPMSIFAEALVKKPAEALVKNTAEALIKNPVEEELLFMLNHFWERRVFARVILKYPTRDVVDNCLKKLLVSAMSNKKFCDEQAQQVHACFLSAGFLSLLNEWLTGRLSLTAKQMCAYIQANSLWNLYS